MIDFQFFPNSNVDKSELDYDLIITEWTDEFLILYCNFTNPLKVSLGIKLDQVKLKVINPFLFTSAISGKVLQQERTKLETIFPRQALPGVNVVALAS